MGTLSASKISTTYKNLVFQKSDNKIYYTNTQLGINEDATITVPSGTNIAYTQYQDIVVGDSYDLTIADGGSFIPDILDLDEV